jgi:hypothetical protein
MNVIEQGKSFKNELKIEERENLGIGQIYTANIFRRKT